LAFAAPVHRFFVQYPQYRQRPLVLPCPLASAISTSVLPCHSRLVAQGVLWYIVLGELTRPLPSTRRSRPGQPAEQGQVHAKPLCHPLSTLRPLSQASLTFNSPINPPFLCLF
jgi:hypothetical protein